MNYEIKKINDSLFEIPKTGCMNVPVKIFASEKLLEHIKNDNAINQGINVACLPGIINDSIMMPDAHQGYGFSIGGVAAFDYENGIITPGGIGFDINCGVRLLRTNLNKDQIIDKIHEVLDLLFKNVPSGVGSESKIRLDDEMLDSVLENGAKWALGNGYGNNEDIDNCEERGCIKEADPKFVSKRAKARGRKQLGTLGAGNHFLEIQYVDEIYDEKIAKKMGIGNKGQIMIMIHCGSRGLGHQVCSDYLRRMEDEYPDIMEKLPEKDLIYAPFKSNLGQEYFKAMSAASNFAWANRHIIGHMVKESFREIFKDIEVHTIYDVAHNIAKVEEHEINGEKRRLIVHRKGATRAFPDQPVLIPGSMGTSSYLLQGTESAMKTSFGSSAHGAGRTMSRVKARKEYKAEDVRKDLEAHKIYIKAASFKGITEEAPGAYKDVDEVIKTTKESGISTPVARLKPLGVIKG